MPKNTLVNQERLPMLFNALGDSNRMKIFRLLLEARHNEFCVSDVARELRTSVPAASKQLKIMEMVGLVKRTRNGQMICYEVVEDNPVIKELTKVIQKVGK